MDRNVFKGKVHIRDYYKNNSNIEFPLSDIRVQRA